MARKITTKRRGKHTDLTPRNSDPPQPARNADQSGTNVLTPEVAHSNSQPAMHVVTPQVSRVRSSDTIPSRALNVEGGPSTPQQGSSQANASIHVPALAQTVPSQGLDESRVAEYRVLIQPRGDEFRGGRASTAISNIIQRHYDGPWTSYVEVPIDVRKLWFEEFGKRYRWHPDHDSQVKINWEKKCRKSLSDLLEKARNKGKKEWIDSKHWMIMSAYYNSEEFQKKSQIAKQNRAKLVGPSHTGGSISLSEHEERERKVKGDAFDYGDFFEEKHKYTSGPQKGEFVNEKAKEVLEKARSLKRQYEQSSDNSVSQPTLTMKECIVQTIEMKKGRIYGMGSEAAVIRQNSMSSSIGETKMEQRQSEMEKELEIMKKKMLSSKRKLSLYKDFNEDNARVMHEVCMKLGINPPAPNPVDLDTIFDTDDETDRDDNNDGGHGSDPPPTSAAAPEQCVV